MRIRLLNPTRRNTQARVLELGNTEYFFSYETCIAVRKPGMAFRRANHWGPTTGRHFNELGCSGFQVLSDAEFEKVLKPV